MKVRKLAVAMALAGGLGTGVTHALGLGEMELDSFLNEPLDAEIALRKTSGIDPDDIFVELASERAYERLGLTRDYFLRNLEFEVVTDSRGNLVVNVTTEDPVREPYLNFLLEVTWPNGRVLREFALLIDPPVYAEDSGLDEPVRPATSGESQPQTGSQRSATQQPEQRDRRRPEESTAREREIRQATRGTSSDGDTFRATTRSDTLWGIAGAIQPDNSVSRQQVMLAIQDKNPDAFMDNNINRLKQGEVLRIPSMEEIRSRSRAQANREVVAQSEALEQARRPVDATADEQPSAPSGGDSGDSQDELRLISDSDNEARDQSDGASAGGDQGQAGGGDSGNAVAMEELDQTRRENEELNSRLQDMEEQVATLQRLLELKDSQLAEMQNLSDEELEAMDSDEVAQLGADSDSETAADGEASEDDVADDAADAEDGQSEENEVAGEADEGAEDTSDATAASEADEADEDTAGTDSEDEGASSQESDEAVAATDEGDEDSADMAAASDDGEGGGSPVAGPDTDPESGKSFVDQVMDAITNNPMYQLALGGGLILLLLLLLMMARRNANREKAFYEELNREPEDDNDGFDLELDDDDTHSGEDAAPEGVDGTDPLADADVYIAYGRLDQAAQSLESAISREPSRTDLRLKLLEVYADAGNRGAFEKQMGELEALDDEDANAEASILQGRLEEAESAPSMDELESQLRSGNASPADTREPESDPLEDDFESEDFDLSGFDDDLSDNAKETEERDRSGVAGAAMAGVAGAAAASQADDREETPEESIDFDMSELELETDDENPSSDAGEDRLEESDADDMSIDFDTAATGDEAESDDYASLGDLTDEDSDDADDLSEELDSLDLEDEPVSPDLDDAGLDTDDTAGTGGDEPVDVPQPESPSERVEEDVDDVLDESFLDELDAELDKVTGEESAEESAALDADDTLDDLDLDVSDDDLALMEEAAESESGKPETEADELELDEELGLEDALGEEDNRPEGLSGESSSDDEALSLDDELDLTDADLDDADLELDDDLSDDDDVPLVDPGAEPAEETDGSQGARTSAADIEESELDDEDDFDFLAGTDEAETKLDLARAYIEMGDSDGARDILDEVSAEGSEEQKAEAQTLLKNLS